MFDAAGAAEAADGIGLARETFVDASRPTKASPPFLVLRRSGGSTPGSDTRPTATPRCAVPDAPGPHGTIRGRWSCTAMAPTSGLDNATHYIEHLVRNGYVMAAQAFPLTSSAGPTRSCRPPT